MQCIRNSDRGRQEGDAYVQLDSVIWHPDGFQLLYRVLHEELVRDLAFSPDSQRFYDVRGTICNIWEPDVRLRGGDDDVEDVSN